MRLVVDTSVLVGELLRAAGRTRLGDGRVELFMPERMAGELSVGLPQRIIAFVRRRGLPGEVGDELGDELASACRGAVEANIVVLDEAIYSALEDEARARSQRDPNDWPVVATALALSAAIWNQRQRLPGHRHRHLDHGDAPSLARSTTATQRLTSRSCSRPVAGTRRGARPAPTGEVQHPAYAAPKLRITRAEDVETFR